MGGTTLTKLCALHYRERGRARKKTSRRTLVEVVERTFHRKAL